MNALFPCRYIFLLERSNNIGRIAKTKEQWYDVIMSRIVKTELGCWEYHGRHSSKVGYSTIYSGGRENAKEIRAHRLVYEVTIGKIPDGIFVCHHCDNPPCVNPKHLFIGTHLDNMQDMANKGRAFRSIGEKSGMAKLSTEQVYNIRKDSRTITVIAKEYGVVKSNISMIKNFKSRKYG